MFKALILCVALILGLMPPLDAQAHAVLVDSKPMAKSQVAGPQLEISLRYNSRVDARRSRLTLTRPGTAETILEVRQGQTEADLAATATGLAAGAWVLNWDVLSVDGHVSRGKVPFTVTGGN